MKKSDTVKLAEISERQQILEHIMNFVSSPIPLGMAALMANHAIYKTGYYQPNVDVVDKKFLGWEMSRIDKEQAAVSVHDSIALFVMIATVAYAMNYRKATDQPTVIESVQDTISGIPKLISAGV